MQSFFNFQVELGFRVSFINYFKTKRIIRVRACCGGVYMFKTMRLVFLFDMIHNFSADPNSSAVLALVKLELVQVTIYTRKEFKSLGIGSLYGK